VAVRSFVLDSQDRIFRVSQAFYSRMVDHPAIYPVPRFAGQRVRMVEASVDAAKGRVTRVHRLLYSWLSFDGQGRLDANRLRREAVEVLDSLLSSAKAGSRKLHWRPKKNLELLLRRAVQGEDTVPDLLAKTDILDASGDSKAARAPRRSVESLLREQQEEAETRRVFVPKDLEDARTRSIQSIVCRRGLPAFRRSLLSAYSSRCAVSGCDLVEVLEATHIYPYRGDQTNHVANGLLLRADLHTLFDLGLMSIEPQSRQVAIHSSLENSAYAEFNGVAIFTPRRASDRPNDEALRSHWQASRVHLEDGR
jgi:hypothetical protein